MNGQWARDPYGRAELRYHDGTRWTEHVFSGGVASVDYPAPAPPAPSGMAAPMSSGAAPSYYAPYPTAASPARQTSGAPGRLIAAGVMTIIEGVFGVILGLWAFSLSTSEVGSWVDDVSGGAITFAALFLLALGATGLVVGINDCKGRNWARITTIVLHAIGAVLMALAFVSSLADDSSADPAGAIILLVWYAIILGLAITGKPGS